MKNSGPWSEGEDRVLVRLAGKVDLPEIMRQVGRSERAVQARAHLLGLSLAFKMKRLDLAKKGQAIDMLSQGVSVREVSDITGIPYASIWKLNKLIAG